MLASAYRLLVVADSLTFAQFPLSSSFFFFLFFFLVGFVARGRKKEDDVSSGIRGKQNINWRRGLVLDRFATAASYIYGSVVLCCCCENFSISWKKILKTFHTRHLKAINPWTFFWRSCISTTLYAQLYEDVYERTHCPCCVPSFFSFSVVAPFKFNQLEHSAKESSLPYRE